jgi:hypothetical protein
MLRDCKAKAIQRQGRPPGGFPAFPVICRESAGDRGPGSAAPAAHQPRPIDNINEIINGPRSWIAGVRARRPKRSSMPTHARKNADPANRRIGAHFVSFYFPILRCCDSMQVFFDRGAPAAMIASRIPSFFPGDG